MNLKNKTRLLNNFLIYLNIFYCRNHLKSTFQEQELLANKMNFCERIKMLKMYLRFALFDKNDRKVSNF